MAQQTIAIIGTTPIGQQLALLAALSGYEALLVEVGENNQRQLELHFQKQMTAWRMKNRIDEKSIVEVLGRLNLVHLDEFIMDTDVIIDATAFTYDQKIEIFEPILNNCDKSTFIFQKEEQLLHASLRTAFPNRLIYSMTSFYPIAQMKFIEIFHDESRFTSELITLNNHFNKMGQLFYKDVVQFLQMVVSSYTPLLINDTLLLQLFNESKISLYEDCNRRLFAFLQQIISKTNVYDSLQVHTQSNYTQLSFDPSIYNN